MAIHKSEITIDRPQHLGSGKWELKKLNDITVIFGKNGSGKSWLLRTLRDKDKAGTHYASPERGGEINFRPDFVHEESNFDTRGNRNMRNFALTYREGVVARIQAYLAKRGNQRTDEIFENPAELERIIHILMPEFQFTITDGNPPYQLLRLVSQQSVTNVNDLSSGETEVLVLALDLLLICAMWKLENQTHGLLLIDEPDSHLHPDLQQHLAKFLVELTEKYQVQLILSTHSTTLLSALGYHGQDKTSVIYLNNAVDVQEAVKFNEYMQEIATCLGGHALMGPLFGVPLLLVEGDDDYKIWSQAPRHGIVKLSAIPCSGDKIKKYQKTLEDIFQSLLGNATQPSGYVLFDSDKSCSSNDHKHIICMNLSCHESENMYLSDEVLTDIGIDWETAKQKIKEKASSFGGKEEFLNTVDSWDRKTIDLKGYINEIQDSIDDKHVNWAMRIGRTIGKQKPTGQLADYLGTDVMNAFWENEEESAE